ncbi:uncharacterized protein LOC123550070 [Mercenaria mercenaria]|uniref:uncharacterized protein LOC123550070 n=1 Tax=Mercenaria mercenaria TaxID=6596 RepID=UPI00234F527A|nr:uncharacterized protein LOC123550070 [Mercenaria mercenaria]
MEYLNDPLKRSQTLSKRRATIFSKMEQLSKLTKTEFVVRWKTPTGSSGIFKSDGKEAKHAENGDLAVQNETMSDQSPPSSAAEQAPTSDILPVNDPQPVLGNEEPKYPEPPMEPKVQDLGNNDAQGIKSKCDICHKKSVGKKNDVWLNCEYRKGCDYWVHTLCVGIVVKRDSDLDDVNFFCPEHIRKFMK